MKHIKLLTSFLFLLLLCSCSHNRHIPDVSIFEELTSEQLSDALKAEEDKYYPRGKFEDIYPGVRKQLESMSEIDKAKVAHLTYRELIDAMDVMCDSVANREILDEWESIYDSHIDQAKRLAADKASSFNAGARIAATRASMYGSYFSLPTYARNSPEYKYMSRVPVVLWESDDCWDYVRIIKYDIDPNFESQYEYLSKRQLARIEDKYPEAHFFLSIHEANVYEMIRGFENLTK